MLLPIMYNLPVHIPVEAVTVVQALMLDYVMVIVLLFSVVMIQTSHIGEMSSIRYWNDLKNVFVVIKDLGYGRMKIKLINHYFLSSQCNNNF